MFQTECSKFAQLEEVQSVTLKVPCDKAHAHILAILVGLGSIVFQGH